jgi:hypothetical protein
MFELHICLTEIWCDTMILVKVAVYNFNKIKVSLIFIKFMVILNIYQNKSMILQNVEKVDQEIWCVWRFIFLCKLRIFSVQM